MPKTSAATRTELDAIAAKTVAGRAGARVVVNLTFEGVAYDPVDVMDALLTKYGAGKVATDKDSHGNGAILNFRITP